MWKTLTRWMPALFADAHGGAFMAAAFAARRPRFVALALASLAGVAAFTFVIAPAPVAFAQDVPQPEVENAKNSFEGKINSNAVYVRSGPSENFYPTLKVDKGAAVTVVGIKYNWLKIEPPAGSFSYVAKAYVQRHGDGTEGVVTKDATPNVRAGSDLNAMKTTVQTKLQPGQHVKILGEQDEYFKIEPPTGSYVYVDARFVDAVRRVGDTSVAQTPKKADEAVPMTPVEGGADIAKTETPSTPIEPLPGTGNPADATGTQVAGGPTTKPSEAAPAVAVKFEELEAKFKDASGKPLVDQPLEDLTTGYTALGSEQGLTKPMRRVVDARLAALKVRTEARESYVILKKNQQEMEQKTVALTAEREELQERIKQNDVKVFTAVGTLRTSSLQLGGGTLYRLTDPETGRTVVYIRTTDTTIPTFINQFIGVKGELSGDPALNLKVINAPTGAEAVDPTKVNGSVAAQIIPPSLLPKIPTGASASTSNAVPASAVEPR
jgi:uncharacterized protein YgiM (DUF1202 family)